MNYKAICLTISILAATLPSAAKAVELCGDFKQGEIIAGRVKDNAEAVIFNGKNYPVTEDGYFILAFGRDQKANADISLLYPDGGKRLHRLPVETYDWDIQRINGIPQSKVTPDSSHDAEIRREQKDVRRSLTVMQPGDYWREGFILPVKGRISGEFGNQRIFNGTPKSPHSGTDIAAPAGTPILAAADGTVIVANGVDSWGGSYGYYVKLDHGGGLQTLYAHCQTICVTAGQQVQAGQVIGYVGHTGRATGDHLHFEIVENGQRQGRPS